MKKNHNFQIVVKKEGLKELNSGAIFGTIYCRINGKSFPEEDWQDFSLHLISWWTSCVLDLFLNKKRSAEILFAEGLFYKILLTRSKNSFCKISCIKGEVEAGIEEEEIGMISIPIKDLIKETISVCKTLISYFKEPEKMARYYEYTDLKNNCDSLEKEYLKTLSI